MSANSSIEWTQATCRRCGIELTAANRVEAGRRLCKVCRNLRSRGSYVKKGPPGRRGWLAPVRNGDKLQARRRINYLVEQGLISHPDDLPCLDCADGNRRHEYDHARGYNGDNQLYVEPVCSKCHHNREDARNG